MPCLYYSSEVSFLIDLIFYVTSVYNMGVGGGGGRMGGTPIGAISGTASEMIRVFRTCSPYKSPFLASFLFPRPSVLDSFSTLSGQTSTLMRQLSSDKFPPIHNRVILPLQVSSDRDCELEVNL